MNDTLRDLIILHRDALAAMVTSLKRSWIGVVAIYLYAVGLSLVAILAAEIPMPLVAGALLAIGDAFAVGALLALVEDAVGNRTLRMGTVRDAVGAYFWDVVSVGFVLWIPLMLVRYVAHETAYGPAILAFASVLMAVFLNPLPEVIYQIRAGSPLESLAESARFVQRHWIEWLLPIVLAAAPVGSLFMFASPARGSLSFGSLLEMPALFIRALGAVLGLSPAAYRWMVALGWPAAAFAVLLFRGHLFAALAGTSRRQRAFRRLAQPRNTSGESSTRQHPSSRNSN